MSWWDTGNTDDVIGDQTADAATDALKDLASQRVKSGHAKPAMDEILAGLGVVILRRKREMEAVPEQISGVVAELESGDLVHSLPLTEQDTGKDTADILERAFGEILSAYQGRWDRNPRVTEWLATFDFILANAPDDFLADGAGREVRAIRIVHPS